MIQNVLLNFCRLENIDVERLTEALAHGNLEDLKELESQLNLVVFDAEINDFEVSYLI